MNDEHEARTWHLQMLLNVIGYGLAVAPTAVYLVHSFEAAAMVGFFIVIALAYGTHTKQISFEVTNRV